MPRIFVGMGLSLKLNLAHQLRIAQRLTEFVDTNFLGWQNIADARKGYILMALADKSFVTFRAIHHLLKDSLFVDDASALMLAVTFPVAAEFYGNSLIEPWNVIVREWSGLSADDPRAKLPIAGR
jgi:hypothetical protein